MAVAALDPTCHPHWQMNVAMWMRRQCVQQSYTNAIDSSQCDADAVDEAVVDAAAAVATVAAATNAAAAVGNDCLAIAPQQRHCWH